LTARAEKVSADAGRGGGGKGPGRGGVHMRGARADCGPGVRAEWRDACMVRTREGVSFFFYPLVKAVSACAIGTWDGCTRVGGREGRVGVG
jgi:hypothetical protein